MCLYIYTKGRGMNGGMSKDVSTVNVVEQGITNQYYVYGRHKSKLGIGTDAVWKVQKGISYADDLKKGL